MSLTKDLEYMRGLLSRARSYITVTVVNGLANARLRLNDQGHSDAEAARMLTATNPHSAGSRSLRHTLDALTDGRIHLGQSFNGAESDLGEIIASWASTNTRVDIADTLATVTSDIVARAGTNTEKLDELLNEHHAVTDWLWNRTH